MDARAPGLEEAVYKRLLENITKFASDPQAVRG